MIRRWVAGLGVLLPVGLLIWSPSIGLDANGLKALALALFAISFFVAEVIPLSLTGLLLLLLFVLFRVVPPAVAFSGFTVPALWLVFSAFILGGGMLRTGLARRMAFGVLRTIGGGFERTVLGFCLIGFLLNFCIPSGNARVALLIPIALEVGKAFRIEMKSRAAATLIMATALSAFFPGFALITSNVPNLVHIGIIESVGGPAVSYGQWAYLHLPVLGVVRLGVIYLVVRLFLWPREIPALQDGALEEEERTPLSPGERKMAVLLCVAVGLWMTDFIHGVKPAWVGLAVGIAALFPRIGVLQERDIGRFANLHLLIYLGSVFGLGTVLAATGVSEWAGAYIFRVIPLARMGGAAQVAVVALITVFLAVLTTHPAIPAVLTPIIIAYGTAQGMDVMVLLMAQVLGLAISFFPYQMPPMITAQGFGAFTGGQSLRAMIPFGVLSVLVVIPLTILYWKLLGFLP